MHEAAQNLSVASGNCGNVEGSSSKAYNALYVGQYLPTFRIRLLRSSFDVFSTVLSTGVLYSRLQRATIPDAV